MRELSYAGSYLMHDYGFEPKRGREWMGTPRVTVPRLAPRSRNALFAPAVLSQVLLEAETVALPVDNVVYYWFIYIEPGERVELQGRIALFLLATRLIRFLSAAAM
jgi:hypothetical protein